MRINEIIVEGPFSAISKVAGGVAKAVGDVADGAKTAVNKAKPYYDAAVDIKDKFNAGQRKAQNVLSLRKTDDDTREQEELKRLIDKITAGQNLSAQELARLKQLKASI